MTAAWTGDEPDTVGGDGAESGRRRESHRHPVPLRNQGVPDVMEISQKSA